MMGQILSYYSSPRFSNLGKRIAPDSNLRLSASYDSFDSDVMSLISDLSLVFKGSVEHLAWLTALENSRYRLYPFCARYHDRQKELHQNVERLKTDLYRRNRKYSKFSYEDLSCAPLLFPFEKPLPVDASKE